jgi:hypothetical protein
VTHSPRLVENVAKNEIFNLFRSPGRIAPSFKVIERRVTGHDASRSPCASVRNPSGKSPSKVIMIAAAEARALVDAALVLTAAISPATPDIADGPDVGPTKIAWK